MATPTIEAGFPVLNARMNQTTQTATFTTSGPSLLVAIFMAGKGGSNELPFGSVTSPNLTWNKVTPASGNLLFGSVGTEIWYAVSAAGRTNETVTATDGGGTSLYGATIVYSILGASASPIGSSGYILDTDNQVTLTGLTTGSLIVGGVFSVNSSASRTPLAFNSPWDIENQQAGDVMVFEGGHGVATGASHSFGSSSIAGGSGTTVVEILGAASNNISFPGWRFA